MITFPIMKSDPDQPSAVKQQCSRSDTVAEPHAMSLLRPPPLLLLPYLSTALVHVKEIGLVLLANVIQLFLLQVFSTILPHITVAKCAAAAMSIIFWISEQRNKFEPECVVVSIMCVVVFYLSLAHAFIFRSNTAKDAAVRGLFCWVFMILGILSLAYAETEERWGPFLMWLWCCCFCLLVRWSGQMLEKYGMANSTSHPL